MSARAKEEAYYAPTIHHTDFSLRPGPVYPYYYHPPHMWLSRPGGGEQAAMQPSGASWGQTPGMPQEGPQASMYRGR